MPLPTEAYESLTAAALCADPFVQEWVFYSLSKYGDFFDGLVAGDHVFAREMNVARWQLTNPAVHSELSVKANEMYNVMKRALQLEQRTEVRYGIAEEALSSLTKKAARFDFVRTDQEIYFFKVIRPLFGQEAAYLRLRYHSELFGMDDDFFRRQPLRMDKLRMRESKIIDAYVNGEDNRRDEYWYCSGGENGSSKGSEVLSEYLGLLRYLYFLNGV